MAICKDRCMAIITTVEKFLNEKDIEGLKVYIGKEKRNIEECHILSKSETDEYIDTLIKDLK